MVPPVLCGGGKTRRRRVDPLAGVHDEVSVVGNERGIGPVCFVEATPRGPTVAVPDAREEVHCFCVGEEVVVAAGVCYHPYGSFVDKEPGWMCKKIQWKISKRQKILRLLIKELNQTRTETEIRLRKKKKRVTTDPSIPVAVALVYVKFADIRSKLYVLSATNISNNHYDQHQ